MATSISLRGERVSKHIQQNIRVWSGFAKEVGDNGLYGNDAIQVMIAPEVDQPGDDPHIYVYLETNGDPVVIGWIADDRFELDGKASEWINAEPWLVELLNREFDAGI